MYFLKVYYKWTRSYLAELGRRHNKVTNLLINAIEKAAERVDVSKTSQLKLIQQNLAVVYPNPVISFGPLGFGSKPRNQEPLTEDGIFTLYKGDKHHSIDTLVYLPKEQTGFPSGYKLRTYFITYRTNILFMKDNETLGSDVIGVGVRGAQIQNLTLPVVIKFKPKIPVSGNELITCVSWDQYLDKNRGGWSKEGCSYKGRENYSIICHCRFVLLDSWTL